MSVEEIILVRAAGAPAERRCQWYVLALSLLAASTACRGHSQQHVDRPPTLTTMATLEGAVENSAFLVTYASLGAAGNQADPDGDSLVFRVEQVLSGRLTKEGGAAVPQGAVLGPNETWEWTPHSAGGDVTAFMVRVFDGTYASSDAVPVIVNVTNHTPQFTVVGLLTGAAPIEPFTVSYAVLLAASDATDVDGDVLTFELSEVLSGTLTQSGVPADVGAILSEGGAAWTWTPTGAGDLAAFNVTATDGFSSTAAVQVTIRTVNPKLIADWIGGYGAATGWTVVAGTPVAGAGDGMVATPRDVFAANGVLYVADGDNNRVVKLDQTTGTPLGWIGVVDATPSGGAVGCSTAPAGSLTPGWCLGGTAMAGDFPGALDFPLHLVVAGSTLYVADLIALNEYDAVTGAFLASLPSTALAPGGASAGPDGVATDGTYVYVSGFNTGTVTRIDTSIGQPAGWIGGVATLPASCLGALPAVDQFTGSWCIGGSAKPGTGGGMLPWPRGIAVAAGRLLVASNAGVQSYDPTTGAFDSSYPAVIGSQGVAVSGGALYTTDYATVYSYDLATGSLLGWMGPVATAPTSCAVTASPLPTAGHSTLSWCTGGSPGASTVDPQPGRLKYPTGLTAANGLLFVADAAGDCLHKFGVATGAPLGWLGTVAAGTVGGWTTQDAPGPAVGSSDGMFKEAYGVAADAGMDALYVASAFRLNKFRASTGEFLGWTGRTATAPTSCDGSLPAIVPGPTGGWCKGGTAEAGFRDGELGYWAPRLALGGGYIYVADDINNTNRVMRFTEAGVFAGWIGTIGSTTALSPAACVSAGVGSFSPDWCFGGFAASASTSAFYQVQALSVLGDTIIIADGNLDRVAKIRIVPGAVQFVGWSGGVGPGAADVPTSCAGGSLPVPGGITNGWCTGGNSIAGGGGGAFSAIQGTAQDGAGNVYVLSDTCVSKLGPDGGFLGWVGTIAGTITGGPCDGLSGQTPHWCTGGTPEAGYASSSYSLAYDVTDGVIYVGELGRVHKLDGASGAYLGWAGEVAATPTGGGFGCTSAPIGKLTPTWCLGGAAADTSTHNGLAAFAISADGGQLLMVDSNRGRVTRLAARKQ